MRFAFNPFLRRGGVAPESSRAVSDFHRSLPGYAPTPLVALPGLAARLGLGRILLKDESHRFGLKAFKGLGASWALRCLLEARRRDGAAPLTTIATATDGNHGRAVAWAARTHGLDAVVFIPAHSAPARVAAIRGEGATVVPVEGSYDDAVARCASESAASGWQVIADTGYEGYMEIPRLVAQGYETLFLETDAQIEERLLPQPDLVLIQGGVGALAAAAVDHYRPRRQPPLLVVVEPDDADCLLESILSDDGQPRASRGRQGSIMAGLNCGLPSLAAWPTLRRGVDLFVSVEDRFAEEAVRLLWRPAPGDPRVESGESGAAGLAGLLALLTDDAFQSARERLAPSGAATALVINTEGATDPEGFQRITGERP
ncbi:MAG TPA: diaminopropionate ammonia-lyase [Patescibacteria group bacterium]|nr:diaminopropionate ammonia-lyase [Patescibacteria group bacterium]